MADYRVGYQGVPGAYSERAASMLAPEYKAIPFPTFEDVFDAVESGAVAGGVIPIENSVHGAVHANYDLLSRKGVTIHRELQLRISHCLMCLPDTLAKDVDEIISHPQALGQCRNYLAKNYPGVERRPFYDTAGAAKTIAEKRLATTAAVASKESADIYGLKILGTQLQSHEKNYTRFFYVAQSNGTPPVPPRGVSVKTSVTLSILSNVPGALFKCLAVFALREIDLLKIESRPNPGSPGEYQFFLDVRAHLEDEAMAKALDHLEEITSFVRVLGCYEQSGFVG